MRTALKLTKVCFLLALVVFIPSQVFSQVVATGSWETKAPMPTARYGPAAGVIDSKFYVASGCCVTFTWPYSRFNALEVYDPATNAWIAKAPIPLALYAAATGVISGKLYVAGGQASSLDGNNVATLQVYDPGTDTWTFRAPMPAASSSATAGVINGKLYVAGGMVPSNTSSTNTLRVYDPATDTWTVKAPMLTNYIWRGSGVVNGILYVIGGYDNSGAFINTVEAYDPVADIWTTKAPMPTARFGPAVEVLNGIIYAVGGWNSSGALNTVEAYDPLSNSWTPQVSMPTARFAPVAGVVNNVLYIVGGYSVSTGATATNEAFTTVVPFSAFSAKAEFQIGPPSSFDLESTFTLGAGSSGINPPTQPVTLQLGTFSTNIPAGSFIQDRKGRFKFEGTINGVTLEVNIKPLGGNSFQFKTEGEGADLSGVVNPVMVKLTIGNNGGTTTVTTDDGEE